MQKLTGIEAVKAKMSLAELARQIGVTRGAVAQWDRIPAERLKAVSDATGLPMPDLRPDMFEGTTS